MIRTHRSVGLAATLILAATALVGCGTEAGPAVAVSTARPTPTPSPSPSTSPSPSDRDGDGIPDHSDPYPDDPKNLPRQMQIVIGCYLDQDFKRQDVFVVVGDQAGYPDFTEVWAAKPVSCDVKEDRVTPVTGPEEKAYKTSEYDDNDISTLYEICADVDPSDVYIGVGFTPSETQVPEISAALLLCPKHPFASKWRQAVKRGKADLQLAAQGRLFGPGTFLVGKEIRPGTYYTTDVEDCYWERQNRSGGIISNNFIISARRVQVTIRSSDYGFHSQRCGTWRPVR